MFSLFKCSCFCVVSSFEYPLVSDDSFTSKFPHPLHSSELCLREEKKAGKIDDENHCLTFESFLYCVIVACDIFHKTEFITLDDDSILALENKENPIKYLNFLSRKIK